ncbi:MAG: hypothetical protein WC879_05615 [Melioribacteraceae bacterium]
MARIQELLSGRDERLDYYQLIAKYPWIIERNQRCILSPDSDGLLCGLFMAQYFDWEVDGFYDGKVMLLKRGINVSDCVFLDMEIYRENIRSIGHHMINYNKRMNLINWGKYNQCIQPNILRNYDGIHDFRLKYLLATIHLLISIVSNKIRIELTEDSVATLFFTDGTFNVLFSYPENVLNWMTFLRIIEEENPLYKIFCANDYTPYKLMLEMDKFFRRRDEISVSRERGDRLRISNTDGSPTNCILNTDGTYLLNEDAVNRIKKFITILEEFTTWKYDDTQWTWDKFDMHKFSKRDFTGQGKRLNGTTFREMIESNPLSWAMTSGDNIEYTLEDPDKLN